MSLPLEGASPARFLGVYQEYVWTRSLEFLEAGQALLPSNSSLNF